MGIQVTQKSLSEQMHCPFKDDGCDLKCAMLMQIAHIGPSGERKKDVTGFKLPTVEVSEIELACGLVSEANQVWLKNKAVFHDK